jgi:hypothetical protein
VAAVVIHEQLLVLKEVHTKIWQEHLKEGTTVIT